MDKIKFWKSWDTDMKYPYLFLLLISILALALGVFHYITGEEYAYNWDKITDLQVVPVPVHEVTRLLETFTLSVDGYLIFEQYDVALPEVNSIAATFLMGILALCIVFYTAAISTMKQLPYFGGMLLLMLFLATFNFDLLGVFGSGSSQTTLLVSIALLAISSYAFQAFWPQTPFSLRVAALMGVVSVLGLLIYSEAEFPAELITMHLTSYSSVGLLIATVLFMLWVSYENVNALIWVNTQAKTPERRFKRWQFLMISILYLINLLLLYLRHIGYLRVDLFYINGYFIFLLSTIAGFWGMRQREKYYKRLFLFRPSGAILYLVFATLSFLSIGYAYAIANDPLIVLFHDLIIYTHLAFGFGFLIYVLINFSELLGKRLPVYKVVYEPKRFSLFSFALMSLMICAVLVMRTQYRAYFYAKAGYYNYLGDLYTASGNDILAHRFYEESDVYDVNNVKANYNLAALSRKKDQRNSEILYLKEALEKRPNPKLYIRLSNLYDEKQYFFEKMYVLQEGIKKFPESAELYNNIALMYAQTSVQDSTNYYFNLAQEYTSDKDFIYSNRLAFYTRQAMLEPAKDLLQESRKRKYKTLLSNSAVLGQLLGFEPADKERFMPDSLESIEDLTLFYNQTLTRINEGDTSRLKPIDRYLSIPENQLFFEDLLYLKALVHHYNGSAKEGRRILENLALQAEARSGYYYNVLGEWMLEERNFKAAAAYFKQAKDRGNKNAFLSEGYALALSNQPQKAIAALQEVGFIENDAALTVAKDLISVLQKDVPSVLSEGADKEKVQYLIANLPQLSTEDVNLIVRAVGDKEFKRRALLARVEYLMTKQRWKDSYEAIQQASSQLQPEGELRSTLNLYQLKMWLHTGSYETLLTKMDQLYLSDRDKRHRFYFKARIADAKGRFEEAATRYEQALTLLMYDEEVVLAAARFFNKYKPKQEKAYNILLSGITYNPYSSELFKAYALESLDQGLYTYADQAQLTLQGLLPATEYSTFIEKLNRKRQEVEARVNNWQL